MIFKRSNYKIILFCVMFLFFVDIKIWAAMINVDGLLLDWGIDLTNASSLYYLDTHLPNSSPNVDFVTEDNAYYGGGWQFVSPLYSYQNFCDAEAIYFDNDLEFIYLAIVQGLPKNGQYINNSIPNWIYPGDIALTINGKVYGLDINDGLLKDNCVWEPSGISGYPSTFNSYYNIISGNIIPCNLEFAYSGNQNNHYVIETKIPMNILGLNYNDNVNIFWTMSCGNDSLSLNAKVDNPVPVPEPNTILLIGMGLLGCIKILFNNRKS